MKRIVPLLALLSLVLASFLLLGNPSAPYTPTSGYSERRIQGWKVRVNKRLLKDHAPLAKDALKLLDFQLYQITRTVPAKALKELRRAPIWVEVRDKRHPCMCYHPSRDWLRENGYNPEKAGSVEVANAATFLKWTLDQPWMVLHELAHAYHHQVLGHDNADLRKAYEKALESKRYESVLHINGKSRRAYALNNDKEYFAETSEAYFGTNDFYPFVRAELKEFDPYMYQVLEKLWGK